MSAGDGLITEWVSLWDLIEHRAAATPDAPFGIDEHEESLTFLEYRDAAIERAIASKSKSRQTDGTIRSLAPVCWVMKPTSRSR